MVIALFSHLKKNFLYVFSSHGPLPSTSGNPHEDKNPAESLKSTQGSNSDSKKRKRGQGSHQNLQPSSKVSKKEKKKR